MVLDTKNIFIDVATNFFGFLVDTHGFDGPYVLQDKKTGFVIVIFRKKNLAVELIFDSREEDIDCKIARVEKGKIAEDYSVDSRGNVVRQSLSKLLREHGVRNSLFTKVTGLSIEDRIKITAKDFLNMLTKYGTELLNDDPSFLGKQ